MREFEHTGVKRHQVKVMRQKLIANKELPGYEPAKSIWTGSEKTKLRKLLKEHGRSWPTLAREMGTKGQKACRTQANKFKDIPRKRKTITMHQDKAFLNYASVILPKMPVRRVDYTHLVYLFWSKSKGLKELSVQNLKEALWRLCKFKLKQQKKSVEKPKKSKKKSKKKTLKLIPTPTIHELHEKLESWK